MHICNFILLNLHPLCFNDKLSIHLRSGVEIRGGVSSFEDREQRFLLHRVRAIYIYQLQSQFEATITLVAS